MDLEQILARNNINATDKELIRLVAQQISCESLDPILNRNNINFSDKKRIKELCELKTISGYLLECLINKLKKYKQNQQTLFKNISDTDNSISIGTYKPQSPFITTLSPNMSPNMSPNFITPINTYSSSPISPTSSVIPIIYEGSQTSNN